VDNNKKNCQKFPDQKKYFSHIHNELLPITRLTFRAGHGYRRSRFASIKPKK